MASWFRSMDMQYVSIIVNEDAAHSCIKLIGQIGTGAVQFTDLNDGLTAFQRRYVSMIKRCDELERKIKYFETEIDRCNMTPQSAGSVDEFLRGSELSPGGEQGRNGVALVEYLEGILEQHEAHMKELNAFNATLFESYNRKVEMQQVLNKTQDLMSSVILPLEQRAVGVGNEVEEMSLLGEARQMDAAMRFTTTTGVVAATERERFERTLFRATRGNCFYEFLDIDQPLVDGKTGNLISKVAFVVLFKSATIGAKVSKICDAFGAYTYELPELTDKQAIDQLRARNAGDIRDSSMVLAKNNEQRERMCVYLAQNVAEWKWSVVREKSIYHTLNLFKADVTGMLRAEGWIVEARLNDVRGALNKSHENMGHNMLLEPMPRNSWPTPPTHYETNKFTAPYQDFVDTYGVPRYKEANPALFTAVTFPFLFGIMYADIGHGAVLLMGGLYLIFLERSMEGKKLGEMVEGLFSARYMITMMGAFAVYAGFIYNDFFALGLTIFDSHYEWKDGLETEPGVVANLTCAYGDGSCVYKMGVDPAWHISSNELLFFNSMKMKLSVIIGIVQMTLGILLKGMNALYFGEKLDFYFEFIPMIIFDMCFFGYMIFLIFLKWSINWEERMYSATCNEDNHLWPECSLPDSKYEGADLCPLDYGGTGDGCQPPNLITTLMNMALMPGNVAEPLYQGQAGVQLALLLLAGLSVPVLLVAKPLVLKQQMNESHYDEPNSFSEDALIDELGDAKVSGMVPHRGAHGSPGGGHQASGGGGHEEHDFSEVVIHQAIETIEFVLGMVSNTASYLRLWALSLAHTELATVFWKKAMVAAINSGNVVAIVMGYGVFAMTTFAVLLAMDVLECFLHALRLHWVEFQNKFYKADGQKFTPLSFRKILNAV